MRLSEAILVGAKIRQQAHGGFFKKTEDGLCSCSLGAAWEAVEGEVCDQTMGQVNMKKIAEHFPELMDPDPIQGELMGFRPRAPSLAARIVEWNDGCKIKRERIAEKLKTLGY